MGWSMDKLSNFSELSISELKLGFRIEKALHVFGILKIVEASKLTEQQLTPKKLNLRKVLKYTNVTSLCAWNSQSRQLWILRFQFTVNQEN